MSGWPTAKIAAAASADRQSVAQGAAAVKKSCRGLVVAKSLRGAVALERGDFRVDRGGLADDAKHRCGAGKGTLPELDELIDDPNRVGLEFGLLAHELRHRHGCALAGGGEVERSRKDVSLGADRVVDRLHHNPGLRCDLADRGRVVSALQEQRRGGLHDDSLGLLGSYLLPGLDRTHGTSITYQAIE